GTITFSGLSSAGIVTNTAAGVLGSLANSSGANGEVLTLSGGVPTWAAATGTAANVITNPSSPYTPSAGTLAIYVECVGGGGGGGGAPCAAGAPAFGSGGGAGAYSAAYTLNPTGPYTITIGGGGNGGANTGATRRAGCGTNLRTIHFA